VIGCSSQPSSAAGLDGGPADAATDVSTPPSTCTVDPTQRYTVEVQEACRAAPPTRIVRIVVRLDDFSSVDAFSARLAAASGKEIARHMVLPDVDVEVPASVGVGLACWPHVVGLWLMDDWWTVADPPWDPSTVGTDECPVIDGACPSHCTELRGRQYDPATKICTVSALVACARGDIAGDAIPTCAASTSGKIDFMPKDYGLREPSFLGFRNCTSAEAATPCD
jgi:hypothetical protein